MAGMSMMGEAFWGNANSIAKLNEGHAAKGGERQRMQARKNDEQRITFFQEMNRTPEKKMVGISNVSIDLL